MASSVLPGVVGVGGVLPGVPVVAVGGLVAVVAKASVVVTFFFRCSHATCRFVVSCSSSSHSEESSSPSEQIPSFLQD